MEKMTLCRIRLMEPGAERWKLVWNDDGAVVACWDSAEEKDVGMAALGLERGEARREEPGSWVRRYAVSGAMR